MDRASLPLLLALTCASLHLGAFLAYAWDKRCARRARRRLSERSLLLWTLLGGAGALVGIFWIRHKSRKTRFLLLALPAAALSLTWQLTLASQLP